MVKDLVVFVILVAAYIAGLIAFLSKVGPYGRLDARRRKWLKISAVLGAIAIVYFAIMLGSGILR